MGEEMLRAVHFGDLGEVGGSDLISPLFVFIAEVKK